MAKMLLRGVAIGAVVAGLSLPAAAASVRPLGDGAAQQGPDIQQIYWHRWHHWHHHHWHYRHRRWWRHHWHYY
jgi:hypothetical protein